MKVYRVTTDPSERESYRFVPFVLALEKKPFGEANRYGICFIPRGDSGRQVYQGPMVPGPWAQTYGLSTVIAANPELGTGAEIRRNRANGCEATVNEGDELILEHEGEIIRFRIRFRKPHGEWGTSFIHLELVGE